MRAGHACMGLQQKIPTAHFFRARKGHVFGHVAMQREDFEFGFGVVQVPLNALVVLAVVGAIEVDERRAFLSVGQNEMRHRGVFDGLRHWKGFPTVAACHGEHRIVTGKGGDVGNGQLGQKLLGVVTEVLKGIKAVLVHV